MNIWPLFIGMGRLGVIWITNYHKRRIFLTIVTIAFMLYHFHIEREKLLAKEKENHGNRG